MSCLSLIFVLAATVVLIAQGQMVKVNYYAESLCPDCIAFSRGPMDQAIKQIGSIFTLTYVPSGNAKLDTATGKLTCQHGPMECLINKVDACLLKFYPSRDQFWPFIHCMDEYSSKQDLSVGEMCAKKTNIDWEKVKTCTNSEEGTRLQMMAYNVTQSLEPPHRYTPWVTVNGKHDSNAEGFRLISVICEAYTGPNKPSACS